MAYVERQDRSNKTYYYLVKNYRVAGGWKKIRKYCGVNPPSEGELKDILNSLDKIAKERGLLKEKTTFHYLPDTEAQTLQDVRDCFNKWYGKLGDLDRKKFDDDFLVRFTYNTNAIEGNRLSLRETSMILTEDMIPSGVSTRDLNETINGRECLEYIRGYKGNFGKKILLKVHGTLTKNTGCRLFGVLRDSGVKISGSEWTPPGPDAVEKEIKETIAWWNNNQNTLHPVELAGVLHNQLVRTHPFTDGNGRTARVLMNWTLHKKGYPMFTVENKEKKRYYEAIEEGDKGDDAAFIKYLAETLIKQYTFKTD